MAARDSAVKSVNTAFLPSTGGLREDEAHLAVIDGLLSDAERVELLDWLTCPGTGLWCLAEHLLLSGERAIP
jgi:hypothetical protein